MAVMAQHKIEVEKLLRLKPARDEAIQREQRNEKRRVDWENECKKIETKGTTVDRIPWDEADMKVKSLIYLSRWSRGLSTISSEKPTYKN